MGGDALAPMEDLDACGADAHVDELVDQDVGHGRGDLARTDGRSLGGDGDEHGAVIAAGTARSPRGNRLLARDLFLAKDGVD
jgi:hypothetical protein